MATDSEPKSKDYDGGCHCGSISFTVTLSPPLEEQTVLNCNCSACRRMGYLLIYPKYDKITWHNSLARSKQYQFNTKAMDHIFCPKCGASIGIDFLQAITPRVMGISVRALNNVDLDALRYEKLDGVNVIGPAGDLSGQEFGGVHGALK